MEWSAQQAGAWRVDHLARPVRAAEGHGLLRVADHRLCSFVHAHAHVRPVAGVTLFSDESNLTLCRDLIIILISWICFSFQF